MDKQSIKQELRELETQINQEKDQLKREELIKQIKVLEEDYLKQLKN